MKTNSNPHVIEALERRIAPATFLVTVLTDGPGDGTLRKAIADANAAAGADVIEFKSGGKIKLDAALPDITDDVMISATKAVTLDGQREHGIIAISGASVDVVLQNLKLINGRAESGAGMKIDTAGGTVLFKKGALTGNRAVGEGLDAHGGGIVLLNGTLTIEDSKLKGNVAEGVDTGGFGGAIAVTGGTLILSRVELTKNAALGTEGSGGGIFVAADGTLTATDATFSKNAAQGSNGVNGAKGAKGAKGARATDPGTDGESGEPGEEGTSGTDAGLGRGGAISSSGGSVTLIDAELTGNVALGGKGGSGGNGGAGGAGGAGGPKARDEYGYVTPAGRRGYGGDGGDGGAAGAGGTAEGGAIFNGASGSVTISNTTIGKNLAKAGSHGKAGKGGAGGAGGGLRGAEGASSGVEDAVGLAAFGGGIQNFGTVAAGDGSVFIGNTAVGSTAGGGAISNGGTSAILNVSDVTIASNKVLAANGTNGGKGAKGANGPRGEPGEDGGGGEEGGPGGDGSTGGDALGGGIYNLGTATIETTTISGNTVNAGNGGDGGAGGAGGAGGPGGRSVRYSYDGYTNVTPAGHRGEGANGAAGGNAGVAGRGAGGGIFNAAAVYGPPTVYVGGSLTVKNTTISGNTAKIGAAGKAGKGGARGAGGTSAVAGEAGAEAEASESGGGGVFSENGTVEFTQATIAKNTTGGSGGGVKIIGNATVATIRNSTIAENLAGGPGGGLFVGLDTVNVISTIIAANVVHPPSASGMNVSGIIVSSFNLIDVDAKLGKLALNGGKTATVLPLAGSPALNVGSNPNALTTDQRGLPRVIGAAIDIGAVEAA